MPKKIEEILKEALIEKKFLPQEEIDKIFGEIKSKKEDPVSFLIKKDLFSKEEALNILSQKLGIPFIDLKYFSVNEQIIKKIPTRIAFYYHFFPLKIEGRNLTIAVSYPFDIKTQDEIRTHLGYNIKMVLATKEDISDALKKYYGLGADTLEKISAPEREIPSKEETENIDALAGDASVIRLVNQILLDAYKRRATDIHIEPYRGEVSIRYRIDGILQDANVSKEIKRFILPIISRIKIMCNLNIVEKRLPQDGRAIVKTQEQTLDLRVSTLPTPYGESVVIRILPTKMLFSLEKLGLSEKDLKILENLISKSHGIIFITGPTGSGKTTTLYACLSKLNTKDRKIITIEDPIEYELKGITQVQVMPEIGLDFAKGLRSILRHDPDIIMIGEVRDLETAEIAIRMALTGHLVFSTLHTNDAPSGITRLLDIGIEPYLVASSIEAFIAQRLVRLICPKCKEEDKDAPYNLKYKIAKELALPLEEVKIYKGRGCDSCNFTGFVGRTGIYEILLIDEVIRDLIIKRTSSEEIKKTAINRGMRTLAQDGWQKVVRGLTTPSEVMRVVSEEEVEFYEERIKVVSKEEEAFAQKRIFPRTDIQVSFLYRVVKLEKEESVVGEGYSWEKFATTEDISAGGIAFLASEFIPVGSILELNMDLPDGKGPFRCLAKVVRSKEKEGKYEIGVCFLDLTGSERARLDSFVKERKRE
jgi:type II secretory ATPase GspE/PulE/Tfp pilus assembly ATPase PilB-like protein